MSHADNTIILPEGLSAIAIGTEAGQYQDAIPGFSLSGAGENALLSASGTDGDPATVICSGTANMEINIPEGAAATLIELSLPGAIVNTRVTVGSNASLHHIRLSVSDKQTDYSAIQHDGSRLELTSIALGGNSSNTAVIRSQGEHTHTTLYGLGITKGNETVVNRVRLFHASPLCQSFQTFRYVADGHSRAVFDGKITVEKHAQKIEAYQKNNNILLSPDARIETDPQLEIYADDVRCSHGATIGRLDEEALFYMRTRGIPYDAARRMLIRSFADETLAGIRDITWLYQAIEKIIESRLG